MSAHSYSNASSSVSTVPASHTSTDNFELNDIGTITFAEQDDRDECAAMNEDHDTQLTKVNNW